VRFFGFVAWLSDLKDWLHSVIADHGRCGFATRVVDKESASVHLAGTVERELVEIDQRLLFTEPFSVSVLVPSGKMPSAAG
tara:strand:- start:789 stop:1031 length:243 start_codon:yes stop_codon:yes gene_type:complete